MDAEFKACPDKNAELRKVPSAEPEVDHFTQIVALCALPAARKSAVVKSASIRD